MSKLKLFLFLLSLLLLGACSEELGWETGAGGAAIGGGAAARGGGSTTYAPPSQLNVERNPDLSNIPGVQEVHWVATETDCRRLFRQLRKQGENFTAHNFFPSGMPGSKGGGHCKLYGSSAIADRFVDTRYNNREEY